MARRKEEERINEIIDALYATSALDVKAYRLPGDLRRHVALAEAVDQIHRTISKLDEGKRTQIGSEREYRLELEERAKERLEEFGKFKELPERRREEIVRIAREKGITFEEAYRGVARE